MGLSSRLIVGTVGKNVKCTIMNPFNYIFCVDNCQVHLICADKWWSACYWRCTGYLSNGTASCTKSILADGFNVHLIFNEKTNLKECWIVINVLYLFDARPHASATSFSLNTMGGSRRAREMWRRDKNRSIFLYIKTQAVLWSNFRKWQLVLFFYLSPFWSCSITTTTKKG